MLVAQDTGQFNLLLVKDEPEPLQSGFFNHLSMIYKMVMLPNNTDEPDYNFMLGTNNGIAILQISKANLQLKLSREHYFQGKVINNLLAYNDRIVAFEYDTNELRLVDRKTKEESKRPWVGETTLCVTGVQMVPGFHPRENSIIFIREPNGVHMVNSQTWHISTLINVSDGSAKFPDLSLLQVVAGDDHQLVVYTLDKADKVLIKRTYSHILKYCLQTASLRSSMSKPENLTRRLE